MENDFNAEINSTLLTSLPEVPGGWRSEEATGEDLISGQKGMRACISY